MKTWFRLLMILGVVFLSGNVIGCGGEETTTPAGPKTPGDPPDDPTASPDVDPTAAGGSGN